MIKFKTILNVKEEKTDLAIGVFTDYKSPLLIQLDELLEGHIAALLEKGLISTKHSDITSIFPFEKLNCNQIYLVGLGKSDGFHLEKYRKAIGKLAKHVKEDVVLLMESFYHQKIRAEDLSIEDLLSIAAESITLATYKIDTYKSENDDSEPSSPVNFYLSCVTGNPQASDADMEQAIEKGIIYGEATNGARGLINEPGNKLTATDLANRISTFAKGHGLEYKIMDKEEMKQKRMGGILGVNRGSTEPPKVIIVKYQGTPRFENITALLGKGVTFDTGGYSIKTGSGMYGMHGDMGGAASAFGAFEIAVRLKLPVNLLLIIPATDNMISADAIKPGDILHMMSGKTVEVTNTDAEGRLILADAFTLAREFGVSRIIDLATLTGSIIAALGKETTGAFTNDQDFFNQLLPASKWTNEDIWQMPLFERDHKSLRKSLVADFISASLEPPKAIRAAAFLKEFALDTPWIHLDIAGTSETSEAHDLGPKGGNGVMARTIAKYLEMNFS